MRMMFAATILVVLAFLPCSVYAEQPPCEETLFGSGLALAPVKEDKVPGTEVVFSSGSLAYLYASTGSNDFRLVNSGFWSLEMSVAGPLYRATQECPGHQKNPKHPKYGDRFRAYFGIAVEHSTWDGNVSDGIGEVRYSFSYYDVLLKWHEVWRPSRRLRPFVSMGFGPSFSQYVTRYRELGEEQSTITSVGSGLSLTVRWYGGIRFYPIKNIVITNELSYGGRLLGEFTLRGTFGVGLVF